MSEQLPRTKFLPPRPPEFAAWSDGLVARLRRDLLRARVLVLRAPGGAGKTTLAREVVDGVDAHWAWVKLDARDDLSTIVDALVHALGSVAPPLAAELEECGVVHGPDSARTTATALANAVVDADAGDVVVVLDDAHELRDEAAVRLIVELLDVAPSTLHLVLTTRHEIPDAATPRRLALGEAIEVGAEQLRLPASAAARIAASVGRTVDEDEARDLAERAGGWAIGVRMLASSDLGSVGHDDLVSRYVEAEVLGERSDADVMALEACAIPDVLTAEVVEAVAQVDDGAAWLSAVDHDLALFVTGIGSASLRWHDLFREVLLERLAKDPERRRLALLRAAAVATAWDERVDHLLAAGEAAQAADVLARHATDTFPRMAPLARVRDRLARLPSSVLDQRPWLHVVAGIVDAQRGRVDRASQRLSTWFPRLDEDDVLGRWGAARYLMMVGDDIRGWSAQLQVLEQTPGFVDLPAAVRVEHHIALAHGAFFAGDHVATGQRHDAAITIVQQTGDLAAAEVLAQHTSPFLAQVDGGIERVERWRVWADTNIPEPTPLIRVGLLQHQALVGLLSGDIDGAIAAAVAAGDLPERLGPQYLRPIFDWALVANWLVRGDLAPAAQLLERSRERSDGAFEASWRIALLARILHEQGDLAGLGRLADAAAAPHDLPESQQVVAGAATAVAVAEWQRASGRAADAVATLRAVLDRVPFAVVPSVGRLQLDLVVALGDAGEDDAALNLLVEELAWLSERQLLGLVTSRGPALLPVLDRAIGAGLQLLAAREARAMLVRDGAPNRVAVAGGGELSPREVEVLRLVAEGRSNREIAEDLVISINTVKTHVRNVLEKLGVGSRTAAAARATHLGIGASPPG